MTTQKTRHQAIVKILRRTDISRWARNHWNGVLRELKKLERRKKCH